LLEKKLSLGQHSGGEFHRHDQANNAPISPLYDEAKTAVKTGVAAFGTSDPLFSMVEGEFSL